ncbi:MAG: hypothetical protein HQM01_01195 [Magnetococcales bacterium]|nr:hypothetical protein [Magnetococcales bacterium]
MNPLSILVVAEGVTDQTVLECLLPAALAPDRRITLHPVQPTGDRIALSGEAEGGWRQVLQWCRRKSPEIRRNARLGKSLFATSPATPFDILLVHLDADLCENEEFQKTTTVNAHDFDLSTPNGRGKYVETVLTLWLWPDGKPGGDEVWTRTALAVEATETWLIAGLMHTTDPERDRTPFAALQAWAAEIENRPLTKKKADRYRRLAERAAGNISGILEKCPHFADLVARINNSDR